LREPVSPDLRQLRDPYARLGGYLETTSDPLTRWRPPANVGNDYLRDFELERTRMFSGIPRDPKTQDLAMTESMGPSYERTLEHLGTSDSMIITVRRVLLGAARRLQNEGVAHATVDNPKACRVRPVEILLPEGRDWFEATEEHRRTDAGVRLANFVTAARL
jgi:phthalate 4,5-dioxygenase oxygenase subunit